MSFSAPIVLVVITVLLLFAVLFFVYRKRKAECGHKTWLHGWMHAFGVKRYLKIPLRKDGTVEYCHECLSDMTIQCAWCGDPIFIGDPITLYTPAKNYQFASYSVVYNENPVQLVGCLRRNCADTGADMAGVWTPPGEVTRIPTLYEKSIMDLENGGDGIVSMTHP